ncbi:MAG: Chromosomal replication initiator protein DnaA [Berkelbacteria bacterium GW2011_GWA2_35_9]|uniref:Chromosomal replication initiator protein DnaA n=1 Tax=Berkelbacteria bacterium GW2011_GWA2_35_9 TaxID=1618333 RepID=A0A0G0D207_9BACT|nr:MAG: Chromosomal replication initiator protein DnaA [Berkelbacteria bacterium GW2011_GWA2_35_9]
MNLEEIWQNTLGELEVALSKANFKTWIKDTELTNYKNRHAIVSVPSTFVKTWLDKKYHSTIVKTLRKYLDDIKSIEFVINNKKPSNERLLFSMSTQNSDNTSSKPKHNLNPDYVFETFVIGQSNRLAYATCQAVAENPGLEHNPLFIYGGVGLGKTHLLQAIGNTIKKKKPEAKILYVSCEHFANEYINAIKTKKMDEFKRKYRQVDIFLIDDIQFLSKKEGTQEEFFHTFNSLHQTNRQIVMTSDRVPKAIPALEERISSRLAWGMIVDISQPDFETRMAVLEVKADAINKKIKSEVLEYIARYITKNIRELEGALIKVVTDAKLLNVEISLESVKQSLKDLISNNKGETPEKLIEIISIYYGITKDELMSKKRSHNLVLPRQICMYILRERMKMSYPKIGAVLGGKDHTTIMHGEKLIAKKVIEDVELIKQIEEIEQKLSII